MDKVICELCRREIPLGVKVIRVSSLELAPERSGYEGREIFVGYNHANCYEAKGPRYAEDGSIISSNPAKGYVKGLSDD